MYVIDIHHILTFQTLGDTWPVAFYYYLNDQRDTHVKCMRIFMTLGCQFSSIRQSADGLLKFAVLCR